MSNISPELDSLLRRVHDRTVRIAATVQFLRVLLIFPGALLIAAVVDAWFVLSSAGLIAVDLLLSGLVVLSGIVAFRVYRRSLYRAEAIALMIHEQVALPPGSLINAVDFSLVTPPGTSPALVELAIRRGEKLAAMIDPLRVVDGTALRRPLQMTGIAVLACLLPALLIPGLFLSVGPRLIHPLSDLPPFTRILFSVTVQPGAVYVGQGAEIRVRVSGPVMPAEAAVVFAGAGGGKTRTPMWREIVSSPPGTRTDDPSKEDVFSMRVENLSASFRFYIDTPDGRSAWHRLEVLRNPLIDRVKLRYLPPAYTGWKPVFETLGAGGISALRRTRVTVECHSNVGLGGGRLELRPGKDATTGAVSLVLLKVDPVDFRSVTGSFEMAWSGSFVLEVAGVDGLPGARTVSGPLDCAPDRPPQIAILSPEPVSVAPESWKVPVQLEASDDVGVVGLTIMTSVGDRKFAEETLPRDSAGQPASRTATHTMDLAKLGAGAGARVRYFAIARDNEPEDGKTAETAVQTLMVITMEEYRDIARAGYRMENLKEEWGQFLSRFAELAKEREQVIEKLAALEKQRAERGGASPADLALMQDLENALRSYQESVKETADSMRKRTEALDLYDVEQVYKDMLRNIAGQLDRQAGDAGALENALAGVSENGGMPLDFAKAAGQFLTNKKPFEKEDAAGQLRGDMDLIDKAARLGFAGSCLQSVIERQRDLADRISSANPVGGGEPDRSRLEKLGGEQRELEKELRVAVNELERIAGECRQALPRMSASAERLVKKARALAAWDDQAAAAGACPGTPQVAADRSEVAAMKLETLLSECKNDGGEMSDEIDGCLSLSKKQGLSSVKQMIRGIQMGMKLGMGPQGSMGGGSMGTMATVGMVGPRPPSNSKGASVSQAGEGSAGRGQQKAMSQVEKQAAPAVAIQAESSMENKTDARQIPGVPHAYRDLAEAYFRRLARDAVGAGSELKDKSVGEKKK